MKKVLLALLIALLSVFIFVSCDPEDAAQQEEQPAVNPLVGRWEFSETNGNATDYSVVTYQAMGTYHLPKLVTN